jgi:hypothetical protein
MPVTGLCFVPTALAKRKGFPSINEIVFDMI